MDYESTALTAELRALTLHSDKFALTLHLTSRYFKKIKCKLYYFGTDKLNSLLKTGQAAIFAHDVQLVLTFACSTVLITRSIKRAGKDGSEEDSYYGITIVPGGCAPDYMRSSADVIKLANE